MLIPYYLLSTYSYDYGYILEKGRYILYEGDSIENKKAIALSDGFKTGFLEVKINPEK